MDGSTVGESDRVGNYSNLSPEAKELSRSVAGRNASGICHPPTEYPLRNYTIVEYRGSYYSLSELQATTTVYHYRVQDTANVTSTSG